MTIGKACEGIVTFWGTDYRRQTRDVHGKVAAERKRSNSESILIAIKKYGDAGKALVSCGENKGFI
ncbi:hypothetical protein [Bacteroides faecis]|uniref:hypothetical protein n=1 Tax=Bacteroides faecis TaxID=674529 RepID=UPI00286E27AB|nr:hypothetical protein [Bacteroides faecis]MCS2478607.1 hypothetical protein [Bacteroides faecis]